MVTTSHVGKAGQLAAMAEFLLLGYNVAIPEVDTGDDIWVVQDSDGAMWRVQVKTTPADRRRDGYSGRFHLPQKQLGRVGQPPLIFVFALSEAVGLWEFVVIPQEVLKRERTRYRVGSLERDDLLLYLAFREGDVVCSGRSFQSYRNNFRLVPYR